MLVLHGPLTSFVGAFNMGHETFNEYPVGAQLDSILRSIGLFAKSTMFHTPTDLPIILENYEVIDSVFRKCSLLT